MPELAPVMTTTRFMASVYRWQEAGGRGQEVAAGKVAGGHIPATCHLPPATCHLGIRLPDQIRRGHRRRANFEQIAAMRVVGGGAGQHQLDEADDHREVVCQEVDGLGVKRDRPGRRDICTQFAATSLFRVHA